MDSFKKSSSESFYKWGESAFTAILADKKKIRFIGGEPDESFILREVENHKYSIRDLLAFYFVRQIPQFNRDTSIKKKSIERLFDEYLKGAIHSLKISDKHVFSFRDFQRWYLVKNGKNFDLKTFDPEEASPLKDGKYFTQRIAHIVGMARDKFLLELIAKQIDKHKKVMVVFGKSHLAIKRKALVEMLGKPMVEYRL